MSKFIGVAEVEEDDEVQLTITFIDGAESVTTGRVRRDHHVWGGDSELRVGAEYLDKLPTAQAVKNYTIELLRRDEKHGYYLAAPKHSLSREVFLWKYSSEWVIVRSPLSGGLVAEHGDVVEPSEHRYFIGTELPG